MKAGERFVRGLADAVPEAFDHVDLADEYDQAEWTSAADKAAMTSDDDAWARTIALSDALQWVWTVAVDVDDRRRTTMLRPEGADVLRRFFGYMEEVIRATPAAERGWIMVELFEGVSWIEDVIGFLGPSTVALLRHAQDELAVYNSRIGRWTDP